MKTPRFKSTILLGLVTLWSGSIALAANISGTYADKGSMLSEASSEVSFHALLKLQLSPHVGVLDHADTATVVLTDLDGWIEIITYTESGTENSRLRWGPRNGVSHENGATVFRISQSRDVFYTFMLSSAADGTALEMKIYKVTPSALGPGANPIGTYFFVKTEA